MIISIRKIVIVILCGTLFLAGNLSLCCGEVTSIIRKGLAAQGSFEGDETPTFEDIFMNIDVANIGNMPSSFPSSTSAHAYSIDSSEFHISSASLKSEYFVGLSPWWSGMFMVLGGGADGWTPEEFDFSSFDYLTFWAKAASSSENPTVCKLEIVDNDGVSNVQISDITTSWKKFSVDLDSLGDLNKDRIKQINIVYENIPIDDAGGAFDGIVYFDEFQFE